jgi:hypothetical protein
MAVVSIVFFLLWPISKWMVWSGTPAPSIVVANVCRRA